MEFIGEIKIDHLNPGYKISFNFNKSENPLVIISDLENEELLSFIKEELRNKKFNKVKYFNTSKIFHNDLIFCK